MLLESVTFKQVVTAAGRLKRLTRQQNKRKTTKSVKIKLLKKPPKKQRSR